MAKIQQITRVFKYGSLVLDDPGLEMSAADVKDFYADVYPELTQAGIEGPDYTDTQEVYEFKKAVGTKGLTVRQAARTEPQPDDGGDDADVDFKFMDKVHNAALDTHGEPAPPPSEALGIV